MTLRTGCPSQSVDLDLDMDPPTDDSFGSTKYLSDGSVINILYQRCKLALIQSRVYRQLYSPVARKQSIAGLLSSITELDRQIEEWKNGLPPAIRPPCALPSLYSSVHLHITGLQLTYYLTFAMIHHAAIFCAYNHADSPQEPGGASLGDLVKATAQKASAVCLVAARESCAVIRCQPLAKGGNACNW